MAQSTNLFSFEFELNDIFKKLDENAVTETKYNIGQLRARRMLLPDPTDVLFIEFDNFFDYD